MQLAQVNPFLTALTDTFDAVLGWKVRRGTLSLAQSGRRQYPISGVVGLSGSAVGAMILNLSPPVALKAAEAMLLSPFTEMNGEVVDAVGELANMIAGQAKAKLEQYDLSVSLPSVILGDGHEIRFPTGAEAVSVAFDTDFGPLRLEVGLATVAAAVEA